MAQIDHSIYFQQKGPDITGGIQDGLKLSEMFRQRKLADQEDQFNDALKGSYTTDAQGRVTFNQGKLSDLAKIDGAKASEVQAKMDAQKAGAAKMKREEFMAKAQLGGQLLGGIQDEETYKATRPKLIENGIFSAEELPEQFDPTYIRGRQLQALNAQEQIAAFQKEQGHDLEKDKLDHQKEKDKKEAEDRARKVTAEIKKLEAEAARTKTGGGVQGDGFKGLPKEAQITIQKMSEKNAGKEAIANSLASGLQEMKQAKDPSVKIKLAEGLLKTLNSPEGADAIGSEEAKRIGGLLQFKMFNVTEPGSMFGRDVDKFEEQVGSTEKSLREGIRRNQELIDGSYQAAGRQAPARAARAQPSGPQPGHSEDGFVFLGGDPASPQSWRKQ
jgi:hypothetical protein